MKKSLMKLSIYSLLLAIMVIFAFTPIGYLKIGVIEITLMCLPVIAGIIYDGVKAGAFLGLVFAITSFVQCFGMSAFGVAIYSYSPLKTILLLFVPRILMGVFSAILYSFISKTIKNKTVNYAVLSASAAVFNTVMFVVLFVALFKNSEYFVGLMNTFGTKSIITLIITMFGINSVSETLLCMLVGIPLCTALDKMKGRGFRK